MGLTAALLRVAARRAHVLVVAVPGAPGVRLAVEAEIARRGWVLADSPADADVLAVAGTPGPELGGVADGVWGTMAAPRARTTIPTPADTAARLDAATATLTEPRGQRAAAPDRDPGLPGGEGVAGLPMADLAAGDRDGLALDVLHAPLGPVLPGWPAGLVVHAVLAGDVITEARAEVLDGDPPAGPRAPTGDLDGDPEGGLDGDVARLDALARVLVVAGWDHAGGRARCLRDLLLAGRYPALAPFAARVGRSWTLRRMTRGVALPGPDPDVAARIRRWCRELGTPAPRDDRPGPGDLPGSLAGRELAAARLVLAALDPDTTVPAAHG